MKGKGTSLHCKRNKNMPKVEKKQKHSQYTNLIVVEWRWKVQQASVVIICYHKLKAPQLFSDSQMPIHGLDQALCSVPLIKLPGIQLVAMAETFQKETPYLVGKM